MLKIKNPLIVLGYGVAVSVASLKSPLLAQCEIHEVAKLTASDAAAQEFFGNSVSVSGNVVIVGSFHNDCADGPDCGAAYVYRFDGSNWLEERKLTASDAESEDAFGWSVAVDGNVAVVGAPSDDCSLYGAPCGAVYVYQYNGSTWVEVQKFTGLDVSPHVGSFGGSVSISGELILVGAIRDNCPGGGYCGAAYVFRFNGTAWVQEQKLTASDGTARDWFGYSVSVFGNLAIVGAGLDDCLASGQDCGSAYIFRFNGVSWIEEQKLTAFDAAQDDQFGFAVAISEDVALVGSASNDCASLPNCGAAYLFRFNGSNWEMEQKLCAADASVGDLFGISVAVTDDVVAVGTRSADCIAAHQCGAAYIYQFNGNSWANLAKLAHSDASQGDSFGYSVSVNGQTIAVGATGDNCTAGTYCGSAYVFSLSYLNADGDLFYDVCDNCLEVSNDDQADDDGDGVGDACDNCPDAPNANQADSDVDNQGDACDPCPVDNPDDLDGDGVCNSDDPCPFDNPDDPDGGGVCTSDDPCPLDHPDDPDSDGVCSSDESCPDDPFKTLPGACGCGVPDTDTDGDTVADCIDLCPGVDETVFAPQCSGAIPTVSTWGLLVLALLLLTMAKARFGSTASSPRK